MTTTALLTDHYELTMVQAARKAGTADRRGLFELFSRRLPSGRRYGVVAGVDRALDAIENFRFGEEEISFLLEKKVVDEDLAQWLSNYRFTGNVWGYAEGEIYFPGSPVLSVEGTFAEAVILETVLLSIYNYDSAVASAASRMTAMAGKRSVAEMGARRMNEWAAVAAARAAYIAGFSSTSNLEAGRSYGIPTIGTAAHSFTLLHDTEEDAFKAQINSFGESTTLLVDTYDIETAIRKGVELTEGRLGYIRLDSGDLSYVAREARDLLDDLGATETKIMVTSDLDEWQIAALSGAPVDAFGVGTRLVTGSGHPTASMVYKLVARTGDDPNGEYVSVQKASAGKGSVGGRKFAMRRRDSDGVAEAEIISIGNPPKNDGDDRDLLVSMFENGERVHRATLEEARAHHAMARAELPRAALRISNGDPVLKTHVIDERGHEGLSPYSS